MLTPSQLSDRVIAMLNGAKAKYRLIQHAPESRCIEVSKLRGHSPRLAIKAILVWVKMSNATGFHALTLLPGDSTINLSALQTELKAKSVSMAAPANVRVLLESEPGGVSPFSFNPDVLKIIIDPALLTGQDVYFSAGKTDESVSMPTEEFLRVSRERGAQILSFCNLPE